MYPLRVWSFLQSWRTNKKWSYGLWRTMSLKNLYIFKLRDFHGKPNCRNGRRLHFLGTLRLSSASLNKTCNRKRKVILCCEENDIARRASLIDFIHLSIASCRKPLTSPRVITACLGFVGDLPELIPSTFTPQLPICFLFTFIVYFSHNL